MNPSNQIILEKYKILGLKERGIGFTNKWSFFKWPSRSEAENYLFNYGLLGKFKQFNLLASMCF